MSKLINLLFSEVQDDKDNKENEIHAMLDKMKSDNEVKFAEIAAEAVREVNASTNKITFSPDTKQPPNESSNAPTDEESKRKADDVTPDSIQENSSLRATPKQKDSKLDMIDLEEKEKDKSAHKRRKSLLTTGRSATLDESTIE